MWQGSALFGGPKNTPMEFGRKAGRKRGEKEKEREKSKEKERNKHREEIGPRRKCQKGQVKNEGMERNALLNKKLPFWARKCPFSRRAKNEGMGRKYSYDQESALLGKKVPFWVRKCLNQQNE